MPRRPELLTCSKRHPVVIELGLPKWYVEALTLSTPGCSLIGDRVITDG